MNLNRSKILGVVLLAIAAASQGTSAQAAEASAPRSGSQPLLAVLNQFRAHAGGGERPVFGEPASLKDHPWQVAIVAAEIEDNYAAQFCGGSTVGDHWVLTAAHCVDGGTTKEMIRVLRGTDDLTQGGERWEVEEIHVHENWDPASSDSDIALLKLAKPVPAAALIPLWPADLAAPSPGTPLQVTGWGRTGETSPRSKLLIVVEVPLQPLCDVCNAEDAYNGEVTHNMLCAGKVKGGGDACKGDSGGPATAVSGGTRRLIGIVSWGKGCGRPKRYGVYTAVGKFEAWIRGQVDGNAASIAAPSR